MNGNHIVEIIKSQAFTFLTGTVCIIILMQVGKNVYLDIKAAPLNSPTASAGNSPAIQNS